MCAFICIYLLLFILADIHTGTFVPFSYFVFRKFLRNSTPTNFRLLFQYFYFYLCVCFFFVFVFPHILPARAPWFASFFLSHNIATHTCTVLPLTVCCCYNSVYHYLCLTNLNKFKEKIVHINLICDRYTWKHTSL